LRPVRIKGLRYDCGGAGASGGRAHGRGRDGGDISDACPPDRLSGITGRFAVRESRKQSALALRWHGPSQVSDCLVVPPCASGWKAMRQDGEKTARGRHFPRPPFADWMATLRLPCWAVKSTKCKAAGSLVARSPKR
jgi:hypothetical protein